MELRVDFEEANEQDPNPSCFDRSTRIHLPFLPSARIVIQFATHWPWSENPWCPRSEIENPIVNVLHFCGGGV